MKKIVFVLILVAVSIPLLPVHAYTRGKKPSPRPTAGVDTNDRITVVHLSSITVNLAATPEIAGISGHARDEDHDQRSARCIEWPCGRHGCESYDCA